MARARWTTRRVSWDKDGCSPNARPLLSPVTTSPPPPSPCIASETGAGLEAARGQASLLGVLARWIPNLQTVHQPVLPILCVSYACPPACPVCPTGPHQVLQTLAFSGHLRPASRPRPVSGLCAAFLSPLETLSQFIQLLRYLTEHLWCARQCPGCWENRCE